MCICWLFAVSAPAAVTDPSFGSSPIPVGAGPRALGMGGAFSAIADDATAATWNPGGMTQLERPELGLSFGWYSRNIRQQDGSDEHDSNIDLDHVSIVVPFHAFGCQQTVGLSWQRQFDYARDVARSTHIVAGPSSNDQTVEVDTDGSLAAVGLSYAIEIIPGLSLGGTLQAWGDKLTGRSHYTKKVFETNITTLTFPSMLPFPPLPPSTTRSTVYDQRTSEVSEGYGAVIGLWWQALAELTVAVVVKPTYKLHLSTTREQTLTTQSLTPPGNTTVSQLPSEEIDSEFHYPTSATIGLAWRQGDRDTIACDVTWTDWSGYRVVESGTSYSPVNAYIPHEDFDDGWAVRVGYEHLMIFDDMVVVARVGALFEEVPGASPTPSPSQLTQTHAIQDRYVGVTLGTSLCFDHLLYDIGGQLRYGRDVGTGQDAALDRTADVTAITVRVGVAYLF